MNTVNRVAEYFNDKPPEHILDWCRNLVRTIRHNGVWGIPRSQLVFRIDQNQKKLILVEGETSDGDFIATKQVFKHIGWDVEGKTHDNAE
jgi:hypothetical protein